MNSFIMSGKAYVLEPIGGGGGGSYNMMQRK